MLLRRAWPADHQSLAHSFPIYEMGSNDGVNRFGSIRAGSPGAPACSRTLSE